MRKIFLFAVLALVSVACNKKYSGTDEGYGSLKISAIIDRSVISIQSRAVNINPETYFLTLQSDKGIVYNGVFPVGGTIPNLPAGTYTGRLKSEAAEFTVPAFDTPFYAATINNIAITSGGTTSVEFVCKQSNAGVKFIYDPSLAAAGYGGIVPVIAQSGYSLSYSGGNRAATGYFTAGNASLSLLDGETPVAISGSLTEIPLTLAAKELWTITLKAIAPPSDGDAAIIATVETEIIDKFMEITIGAPVASTIFHENFEQCSGPNYPVAGETFSSSASFPSLATALAVTNAGLEGWTFVSGYTCNNGLKMGLASTNGIATTPELTAIGATPATIVITFMAANWETTAKGLKVDVIGDGAVVSPIGGTVTLPAGTSNGQVISEESAMKQYTVVISGATQNTQIVFSPSSSSGSNRYFLADVFVSLKE